MIAGIFSAIAGFARFDMFTVRLTSQVLSGDFAVTVHQDDKRFFMFVLHDERLYDVVFIHYRNTRPPEPCRRVPRIHKFRLRKALYAASAT